VKMPVFGYLDIGIQLSHVSHMAHMIC
jgi:hypothetical protein